VRLQANVNKQLIEVQNAKRELQSEAYSTDLVNGLRYGGGLLGIVGAVLLVVGLCIPGEISSIRDTCQGILTVVIACVISYSFYILIKVAIFIDYPPSPIELIVVICFLSLGLLGILVNIFCAVFHVMKFIIWKRKK